MYSRLLRLHVNARAKGSFNFEQSLIERIACEDEVDQEILRLLFETGSSGLLPKDLAVRLDRFNIMRHQVSRRILRMNRRIERVWRAYCREEGLALGTHRFCNGNLGRN